MALVDRKSALAVSNIVVPFDTHGLSPPNGATENYLWGAYRMGKAVTASPSIVASGKVAMRNCQRKRLLDRHRDDGQAPSGIRARPVSRAADLPGCASLGTLTGPWMEHIPAAFLEFGPRTPPRATQFSSIPASDTSTVASAGACGASERVQSFGSLYFCHLGP